MNTGNALQSLAIAMLTVLVGSGPALAQQAKKTDEATIKREQPAVPESSEYVNLPEVIAIGKRWRLDDEIRQELWRNELRQDALNKRENERLGSVRKGAVATDTSSGGRFKAEFLPYYDPANARTIDMQVDGSRSEVVELFRGSF